MSALPAAARIRHDATTIEAFEAATIDPDLFDHEAHIYVAWSYVQKYEIKDAIARFCSALRRLTIKLGIESKYHETITWFFIILIAERMSTRQSDDWHSFKRQNRDLFAAGPSIVGRYYSRERLHADLARRQFLLPDRLPR